MATLPSLNAPAAGTTGSQVPMMSFANLPVVNTLTGSMPTAGASASQVPAMFSNIPAINTPTGTKVQTRYLVHTAEQAKAVSLLYKESRQDQHSFTKGNADSQRQAQDMLKNLGLDDSSRSSLESRWNVQWSTSWDVGLPLGSDSRKRMLFQWYISAGRATGSACGYDPQARQERESKKQASATSKAWERRVPYNFTGCTAHVEITERSSDGEITRIMGSFIHDSACQSAVLKRLPAVPLHEHVYEVALEQMEAGASITGVQARNREMMEKKEYRGMQNMDPKTLNVRYHLLPTDNTALYRKFSRLHGVDTRKAPQYNIDDWLNPSSPNFRPEIRNAIFYYASRGEAGERFKVCISTPEMKEAAWKYAHHSQLVLDGTFGICTSRLLLFIALARDEHGKGVPIAFFLFSAPTGNKATHAGYNTAILEELISQWKSYLGNHSTTGDLFRPYVAITDTDTKERAALLKIWPTICLLLCKFHLRQCWTNHRKTAVRGKGSDYWKDWVVNAIRGLEVQLISTVNHSAALSLIALQRKAFLAMAANPNAESFHPAQGGIKHLDYLVENWMPLTLWQSWSEWGRVAASTLLKIPVEGVIPTTNHLESFNAILKRKHLAAWLHSGHRLRFDFLINILITRILPGIYSHRKSQQDYKDWLALRFKERAGGENLVDIHARLAEERETKRKTPICWWGFDPVRDAGAEQLIQFSLLSVWRLDSNAYIGKCYSSAPLRHVVAEPPTIYETRIHRSGISQCSCPDFISRGGACKHLRGTQLFIEGWIKGGLESFFIFPQSLLEAEKVVNSSKPTHGPAAASSSPPTAPLPLPSLLFDPIAIQSLGKDATTLDDQESFGDPEHEGSNSGSDSEVEFSESNSLLPQNVEGHFNTTLHQSAVDEQIQKRVEYDINRLLPSLHGLANMLSDIPNPTPTPALQEFSSLLSTIQLWLNSPSTATSTSREQIHHGQATSTPSVLVAGMASPEILHHNPRKRQTILLPPSPERRQKRKDSHAPF